MRQPPPAADAWRSIWLVGVTVVLLLSPFALVWLTGFDPGDTLVDSFLIVDLPAAPVAVVLTHFRLHRPRYTRLRLAIVTGFVSLVLAAMLGVGVRLAMGPT